MRPPCPLPKLRSVAVGLCHDRAGVALIEFAFALPILVLLYIAGYQLTDGISAYRKVTLAVRTIADVTSQYSSVKDSDLDMILNASQQVMSPYDPASATMTVSQIKIDNSGNATVDWSKGKNTDGLQQGLAFTVPASIRTPNTSLIIAQIIYTYKPVVAASVIGTFQMKDQIIMSPRATATIGHS